MQAHRHALAAAHRPLTKLQVTTGEGMLDSVAEGDSLWMVPAQAQNLCQQKFLKS